jgi:hypothetical protein
MPMKKDADDDAQKSTVPKKKNLTVLRGEELEES